MKRFLHPLFALLLSLLLIGSQQAAFAHLLTHLKGEPTAVTHYQNDRGPIDQLADTCTMCIAFAGVGGSAPTSSLAVSVAAFSSDSYLLPAVASVFTRSAVIRRARGPPAFL